MKNLIKIEPTLVQSPASWRNAKPFSRTISLKKKPKKARSSERIQNLNHHLWNNNGTWFIHYTIYPTALTKERQRASLRTRDVEEARAVRDLILEGLEHYRRGIT